MADDLVTLATFRFASKAEYTKWVLEQEGIQAFVFDGNTVTADWFLGNAIGYVKLMVLASRAEAALEIVRKNPGLLDQPQTDVDDNAPERCLSCNELLPEDCDRCPSCGWSYHDVEGE
jgi:hypothetical protein